MNISLNGVKLSQADVSPDDIFMIKMDFSKHDMSLMQSIFEAFKFCFPGNKCMILPLDCEVNIIKHSDNDFIPATQEELFAFLNINKQEEREQSGQ